MVLRVRLALVPLAILETGYMGAAPFRDLQDLGGSKSPKTLTDGADS